MIISVGTDIESVKRFKLLIESKKKLLKKIFFEKEYNYAMHKANPEQSFAGIWCAKEATIKAFGKKKKLNVKQIEIRCFENNPPEVVVSKNVKLNLKYNLSISISHTKDYANAVAILIIEKSNFQKI